MHDRQHPQRRNAGFTLIELLVVIAIIGLLISILMPALSRARSQGRLAVCLTRLRTAGQGLVMYANANRDVLVPARLPKIDDDHWRQRVVGGVKYRPTFLTMMETQMGVPAFEEPLPSATLVDRFGQPGDRQNYASEAFVCPEVQHWVDERNGAYGFNYQFLGNARLRDEARESSYKNWPVPLSRVRTPAHCVAVADNMGTAASFRPFQRGGYEDNDFGESKTGRSLEAFGNEGFNLDPPRIDPENGEITSKKGSHLSRTALHERHAGKGCVLWIDGHVTSETLKSLGYTVDETSIVTFEGNNRYFNIRGNDEAWTE